MEKLNNILTNLYTNDSKLMLYIYIAIAVITVILVIIIVVSSISTKKDKEEEPVITNNSIPEINSNEIPIKEEKMILPESTPEIKPLPIIEKPKVYDNSLESNSELDLTRPIQRVTSATDLLSEFLPENDLEEEKDIDNIIETVDLNKSISVPEEKNNEIKPTQPIFSSVFLDRKSESVDKPKSIEKPKVQLELTPIEPLEIDSIKEVAKTEKPIEKIEKQKVPEIKVDTLRNESTILENKNEIDEVLFKKDLEIKEELRDDSLDTKVDIFNHESLVQQNAVFDPFEPKIQEELLDKKDNKETLEPEVKETKSKEEGQVKTSTLTTEDIRKRLTKLQSKVNNNEESRLFDEVIEQIGLDEVPDFSQMTREETKPLRK